MWDRCPLHVVVAAGDALRRASRLSAAIQEHLHAGVDIEAADVFGKTPLILAAEVGNTDAVGCLLKSGASPMARTLDGWTALHLAAGNGHTEVVQQASVVF